MAPTLARLTDRIPELLAFEAPYLEAKLLRLGVVETREEARGLFQEVKKYLVLAERQQQRSIPMFSVRVDEVWHQFVLFTAEYAAFCARFAGRFLHHVPDESAPPAPTEERAKELSFAEFRADYEALFGQLDPAWMDELSVRAASRLGPSLVAQPLAVHCDGGKAQLVHAGQPPALICSVDSRAADALRFIARERCFLVRELPGLRHDSERVALCRTLVKLGVLRLAP
jgi:hypothetical protein